jgi:hypothetical protein
LIASEKIEPCVTAVGTGVMIHPITLMLGTRERIIHAEVDPLVSGGFSKFKLTTGSTFYSIISMVYP